ncbi:hypothetical protein [Flavobacterium solisilvae]|uniref:Uncharacterized protein n=1 Tax=Flavobacterium solisilvae TaxID=1852019 RepID=A0ABX1QT12_9FLAO|nr:hypothetical protein [Flavobacterium solisilvae]NMH25351.1 hypothetical protein [Flavobacterium solisilvae]
MQLKKEAFSGMVWVFIDYFLVKDVSFVGSIILDHLLMPSDFGIMYEQRLSQKIKNVSKKIK